MMLIRLPTIMKERTPLVPVFVGPVEHHGRVQRLVNVSDQVQQKAGHQCPLKAVGVLVGLEDAHAPVDDVDGVDVLLVLSHALEGEVGVVDSEWEKRYMFVKW